MQDFYVALFVGLGLFAAVLESLQVSWVRPGNADPRKCCADVGNADYKKFRNNYVLIYGMMMGKRCSMAGQQFVRPLLRPQLSPAADASV